MPVMLMDTIKILHVNTTCLTNPQRISSFTKGELVLIKHWLAPRHSIVSKMWNKTGGIWCIQK